MPVIHTARLLLVPATPAILRAELESAAALAQVLGVEVPGNWPPELYDEGAVRWMLDALEREPAAADWGFYYVALQPAAGADRPLLIGASGYKGPPDTHGTVEIGYGILPEHRRRGYAREAVDGLLDRAFADARVARVIAHTLPDLVPSIAVLRSAGFSFTGPGADPQEPEAIAYELTRAEYNLTAGRRGAEA